MKVYLAHNYAAKHHLRQIADELEGLGVEVTSRWIRHDHKEGYDQDIQRVEAAQDIVDVMAADALVLWTDNFGDRPGRGKYVELGIALAQHKRILLVGDEQSNCVFYFLDWVEHLPASTTTPELVKVLLGN